MTSTVYDVSQFRKIEPKLLLFDAAARIPVTVREPRGVAAGADGRIYVAGADAVEVFDSNGKAASRFALSAAAGCIAVDADGVASVGLRDRVDTFDPGGKRRGTWEALGADAVLTSIAVAAADVFVADAGNRRVHRFDRAGKRTGILGDTPVDGRPNGFLVPSPYFDVAVGPNAELWVVNPGEQRVENCTYDGRMKSMWGQSSMAIDGFCGCCNPSHIAIRADGAFVTSEKGLPRVKLYDPKGVFLGVVAGPEDFAEGTVGLDLAVDARGRVLVLDPTAGCVRVYVDKARKQEGAAP